MTVEILYDRNDMLLELIGLTDEIDSTFINSASVTVTLTDAVSGMEIAGATWPMALSFVAASNGNYRAVLPAAIDLTPGQSVRADIAVNAGAKGLARFEPLLAVRRRALA